MQNQPDLVNLITVIIAALTFMYTVAKYLSDRRDERNKRAEERFYTVVKDLGSDDELQQIAAAAMLRTFLQPSYKQFHTPIFYIVVGHLRRDVPPSIDPTTHRLPTPLAQALADVLTDAYLLAQREMQKREFSNNTLRRRYLDATGINLQEANLHGVDLKQIWMREANFTNANLAAANLHSATLTKTVFTGADLELANFQGAYLRKAKFIKAKLVHASFDGANLREADLTGANLADANPEAAKSLQGTIMRSVSGLSERQREDCLKKGALVDNIS